LDRRIAEFDKELAEWPRYDEAAHRKRMRKMFWIAVLPRLLIPTNRGFTCLGTKPSQAAKSRPRGRETIKRALL
jgi:hypothetical protein